MPESCESGSWSSSSLALTPLGSRSFWSEAVVSGMWMSSGLELLLIVDPVVKLLSTEKLLLKAGLLGGTRNSFWLLLVLLRSMEAVAAVTGSTLGATARLALLFLMLRPSVFLFFWLKLSLRLFLPLGRSGSQPLRSYRINNEKN